MPTLYGDARSGKLAQNLVAFGRVLRRAGLAVDAERIGLAQQALAHIDLGDKAQTAAALQAIFVSREQDRAIFAQAFEAFFKNPEVAQKLLSQMLPTGEGKAEPSKRKARVNDALNPQRGFAQISHKPKPPDQEVKFDMAMTASDALRLKHADFNQLSSAEYAHVMRHARALPLSLPSFASRRMRSGMRGHALAWQATLREAAHTQGEPLRLVRRERVRQPLPLVLLVDVSGSMERYARLLLAYLHAATRGLRRKAVFSFGNRLTPLDAAFDQADCDDMLAAASAAMADFAGGTQLGASLATLREQHARSLVGRRSLVLLISDGLDTGEPAALEAELQWLKRHSKALVWLNPLLRFDQYTPSATAAAVLKRHAHAMLAVHNIASLEQLSSAISRALTLSRF